MPLSALPLVNGLHNARICAIAQVRIRAPAVDARRQWRRRGAGAAKAVAQEVDALQPTAQLPRKAGDRCATAESVFGDGWRSYTVWLSTSTCCAFRAPERGDGGARWR